MKKIMMSLALLLISYPVLGLGIYDVRDANSNSYSIKNLKDDIVDQSKLTILKSATPGYFYNLNKGVSQGGVITSFYQYRFLTADTGWVTPFDAGRVGTAVLGGSLHIDQLIRYAFPDFTSYVTLFVPQSAYRFWDRLSMGFYAGHDFDEGAINYGLYSGLEFRF